MSLERMFQRILWASFIFVVCFAGTAGIEGMRYLQEYFVYPDDENDQVKIHWMPTTENEVKEYHLEKSHDNKVFETWKSLESPETAHEMLEVDFDPFAGWSYYRMSQVLDNGDTLKTPTIPVFLGLENLAKGEIMVPDEFLSEKTTTVDLSSFNGKRLILVLRDANSVEYLYDKEVYVDEKGLFIQGSESLPLGKYTITASSQDYVLGLMVEAR